MSDPIAYGLCQCGCGRPAPIAQQTSRRYEWRAGEPCRYIQGHGHRKHQPGWKLEDRGYETPCKTWTGAKSTGYGVVTSALPQAHVLSYLEAYGSIPDGYVLHHVCGNRDCVEPTHLIPMSRKDHVRIHAKMRTHCPHGHPYAGDNLIMKRDGS